MSNYPDHILVRKDSNGTLHYFGVKKVQNGLLEETPMTQADAQMLANKGIKVINRWQ